VATDSLISVFPEFDKDQVFEETKRLRRHIKSANITIKEAVLWEAKEFLQFILKWDFTESLPTISVILQYYLTICVSVASCERSFSKLKLIKNFLRSTMSEDRLNNLAILSIERKTASEIDFDNIINKFSSMKARKHTLNCI